MTNARPEKPEFNPTPSMTLGEIIEELKLAASNEETSCRVVQHIHEHETPTPTRRLRALDYAHKLLEAMAPNWPEHKRLIARAQGVRDAR